MLEISIIIISVIMLILLKLSLNINFKSIKKLQITDSEKRFDDISNKLPNEEEICKTLLKKINKEDVKVKLEPEYNSCLYTVFNNTITIGKFKENYMKPQTIAHECIHASQSKRTLWFNFIVSNIYLIYFIIGVILAFLNKLPYENVFLITFIFLSILQYIIKFSLENEAMIKAKYIAKEYINENNILSQEEITKLFNEYDKVNNIGIPFMNYYFISMNIVKIIIFAFVCLI